jgi:hypothetical protein
MSGAVALAASERLDERRRVMFVNVLDARASHSYEARKSH